MDPRAILLLAPRQRRALDLQLFVQQADLVVPSYQLRAEDVALVNDRIIFLPLREGLRGAFPSKTASVDLLLRRVDGVGGRAGRFGPPVAAMASSRDHAALAGARLRLTGCAVLPCIFSSARPGHASTTVGKMARHAEI